MKGSPHFNPDPDAETLYKAMKGIGKWMSADLPTGLSGVWPLCSRLRAPQLWRRVARGHCTPEMESSPEKHMGAPIPALVYTPPCTAVEEGEWLCLPESGGREGVTISCACLRNPVSATVPHSSELSHSQNGLGNPGPVGPSWTSPLSSGWA